MEWTRGRMDGGREGREGFKQKSLGNCQVASYYKIVTSKEHQNSDIGPIRQPDHMH